MDLARRGRAATAAVAGCAAAVGSGTATAGGARDPAHRAGSTNRTGGKLPHGNRGTRRQPQHFDPARTGAPNALQRGAEFPGPQPEDAAGGAAVCVGRTSPVAVCGEPAGGADGRHRATPAKPGGGQRVGPVYTLPAPGTNSGPRSRFAGQSLCRQGVDLQH